MLTKKEFIKQYKKLTPEQKKEVKQFHEEKYKNATMCIFGTSGSRKILLYKINDIKI